MRSFYTLLILIGAAYAQTTSPDHNPAGSWIDQFKCTADLTSDQTSVIDKDDCTTRTDANSQACLWCDLSALLGSSQGVCVSSGVKQFLGPYWEQLCSEGAASQSPNTPANHLIPVPIPIIPIVTSSPAKAPVSSSPVAPPPAINPTPVVPPPDNVPDNGSFAGAFSCATDDSSKVISDQTTCNAKKDSTSTEGKSCVWCPLPLVGGGCITNSDATSISWMCKSFELLKSPEKGKNLRGVSTAGWEILDTSCLGDTGNDLDAEKESCAGRSDMTGNSCMWCDGAGVLGLCVSPSQKNVLGNYMACEDLSFTAVE
ncbi:hypothetical protein ACHAXN_010281 [Cyclotella atomus]|jgi:hypothetical protein